jgi:hypothetical protein
MKNPYIHKKLVHGVLGPIFYKTTVDCAVQTNITPHFISMFKEDEVTLGFIKVAPHVVFIKEQWIS